MVRKINFAQMSTSQLESAKGEIEQLLESRKGKEFEINQVIESLKTKGLSVYDLLERVNGGKGSRSRVLGAAAIKFRHPDNTSLTWSGRGKRPTWIKAYLEKGGSMDNLAV